MRGSRVRKPAFFTAGRSSGSAFTSAREKQRCYKLMLMTGSKQESTLRFYREAGYRDDQKTAFVQWLP